jgi:hypothetical protein
MKVIVTFHAEPGDIAEMQRLFECWAFAQLGCRHEVEDPNTGDVLGEVEFDAYGDGHDGDRAFTVELVREIGDGA